MKKKILIIFLAILSSFCMIFVGCEGKLTPEKALAELDGFNVPEIVAVEKGSEYSLQTIIAFGKDGKEYTATMKVTSNGKDIEVANNKFIVKNMQDYIITYSIEYKQILLTKQTKITVKDTTKPQIKIAAHSIKVTINTEITLPSYEITDNNEIKSEKVEVFAPDKAVVAITDGKFTPNKIGKYTLKVTVTDISGNENSAESHYFVSAEYAVMEDFETGVDSSFISTKADTKFTLKTENNNSYATASLSNWWPDVIFNGGMVAEYVAKGYEKLHITIWGSNVYSHTIFFTIADKTYKYFALNVGEPTEIYLDVSDLGNISKTFNLVMTFLNDGDTTETFNLNVDDIYGVYGGEKLAEKTEYSIKKLYEKLAISSKVAVAGFNAYEGKKLIASGNADGKFTPPLDTDYVLEFILENGKGSVRAPYVVMSSASKLSFEDGKIPNLLTFNDSTGSISTDHATEGAKSLKVDATTANGYPGLYINKYFMENVFKDTAVGFLAFDIVLVGAHSHEACFIGNSGDGVYLTLEPNKPNLVSIPKSMLQNVSDGKSLQFFMFNEGGTAYSENFSVYLDNFRGIKTFDEKVIYASATAGEALVLPLAGVTKVIINGTEVEATITETNVTISSATLSGFEGLGNIYIITATSEYFFDIEVITDKISFEVYKPSIFTVNKPTENNLSCSVNYPTDGKQSLHFLISGNDGYPELHIDMKYLDLVFGDAAVTGLSFDVFNDGANDHGTYYPDGNGGYIRPALTAKTGSTVTITREVYLALKAQNKTEFVWTIVNGIGEGNEWFNIYLDNFRGVKKLEKKVIFASATAGEALVLPLKGVTKVIINGTAVEATITETNVTLTSAILSGFEGLGYINIISATSEYFFDIEVITDKISFEVYKPSIFTVSKSDQNSISCSLNKPTDGKQSLHFLISGNDGYPELHIDMKYLDLVFGDTAVTGLSFDVFNDGANNHGTFYPDGNGDYVRPALTAKTASTVTITREVYLALKAQKKTEFVWTIVNASGEGNEWFNVYLDNFRGVK